MSCVARARSRSRRRARTPARTWQAHQRTPGDRLAAFASVSRGGTANRFGAAILTARFRPEQLAVELLGLVEGELARTPAVADGLADERGSEMTPVRIANGAAGPPDRHPPHLFHVFRPALALLNPQ